MEKQLTTKEVAELLKCTEDTVRSKASDLKGSKATGVWLFNESDVEAYRNGSKVVSNNELDKVKSQIELINQETELSKAKFKLDLSKKMITDNINQEDKEILSSMACDLYRCFDGSIKPDTVTLWGNMSNILHNRLETIFAFEKELIIKYKNPFIVLSLTAQYFGDNITSEVT